MSMVVWVMTGIAIWHFTVWVPDRFWGGIVGAFVTAIIGAAIFGFVASGFTVPGRHDTELVTALEAIPGAILGMAAMYVEGVRRERADATGVAGLPRR